MEEEEDGRIEGVRDKENVGIESNDIYEREVRGGDGESERKAEMYCETKLKETE